MAFSIDILPKAQGCYLGSRAGGCISALTQAEKPDHSRDLGLYASPLGDGKLFSLGWREGIFGKLKLQPVSMINS